MSTDESSTRPSPPSVLPTVPTPPAITLSNRFALLGNHQRSSTDSTRPERIRQGTTLVVIPLALPPSLPLSLRCAPRIQHLGTAYTSIHVCTYLVVY
jgi:hypothetical protein